MCGLVGIFDTRGKSTIDKSILHRMNEAQLHRGPDEGGIHVEPGVGLGHRRLSIIDLSSGQQPLFNEDKTVAVVYNGEIYNFPNLTDELKTKGHVFATHCDTEVIVHAWEEWGENCVEHFRGMFAFAIWDRNRETFFIARDRMGIKPLFYAVLPNGLFLVGSELKTLLQHPKLPRKTCLQAVEDYFAFGYVPEPRTILEHVFKLNPGHTLTLRRGRPLPDQKPYWDAPFDMLPPMSEQEAMDGLMEQIREAVRIRLVAEVPLGAFLSGGVDSSAVVAMMAALSEDPVNTCSIAFGDAKFNESDYARRVAERYRTNHHVDQVDTDDFGLVDKLARLYDEPYADSSAIPTYRVCELARKRVTVALSGDGGDENLAGYHRYRLHQMENRMRAPFPAWFRHSVFGFLGTHYPKLDWAPRVFRGKTTFQALARDALEGYMHWIAFMKRDQRDKLFSKSLLNELQGYNAVEIMNRHAENAPTDHPLSLIQYLDMKTYLVGDILTKVDRASMAHSLEVRVPLLDHKVVEWISGLPPDLKYRSGEGKYIFKKALEKYIDPDIMYRRKMGFAVPLASWFRGPLKQHLKDALLGDVLGDTGLFEEAYIKQLIDQHLSGRRDNSTALWQLLMFESYQRLMLNEGSANTSQSAALA